MPDRLARLMRRIFRSDEADARDERSEIVGARIDAVVAEHQERVKPQVDRMRDVARSYREADSAYGRFGR